MQMTIDRYLKHSKDSNYSDKSAPPNSHQCEYEIANIYSKIEMLEASRRKLLGEDLASVKVGELNDIEHQLEKSLESIRARKDQLLTKQIEELKEKERALLEENTLLQRKARVQEPLPLLTISSSQDQESQQSDVVTDLFIGRPGG